MFLTYSSVNGAGTGARCMNAGFDRVTSDQAHKRGLKSFPSSALAIGYPSVLFL